MCGLEDDVKGLETWSAEALRRNSDERIRMMRLFKLTLADDAGTHYTPGGGHSGGRPGEMTGDATFGPPPPREATMLRFTWFDVVVEVRLR